jgi:hypothetical protein
LNTSCGRSTGRGRGRGRSQPPAHAHAHAIWSASAGASAATKPALPPLLLLLLPPLPLLPWGRGLTRPCLWEAQRGMLVLLLPLLPPTPAVWAAAAAVAGAWRAASGRLRVRAVGRRWEGGEAGIACLAARACAAAMCRPRLRSRRTRWRSGALGTGVTVLQPHDASLSLPLPFPPLSLTLPFPFPLPYHLLSPFAVGSGLVFMSTEHGADSERGISLPKDSAKSTPAAFVRDEHMAKGAADGSAM